MSDFSCIGLDAETPEAFEATVDRCCDAAASVGGRLDWRDASGARVVAHLEGETIACITPYFDARQPSRWRVTTRGPHLQGCIHCSGATCDVLSAGGSLQTRTLVQWLHFTSHQQWLATARTFELEVVGFAQAIRVCPTPEDFEAWQAEFWRDDEKTPAATEGKPTRFAEEFFMPVGMFGEPMDATALLSGRVQSAEWLTNTLTGTQFGTMRLSTLAGDLNVVFPTGSAPPAEPGHLVVTRLWLVGEPGASLNLA